VPQLSTKGGIEIINRLDKEAHTSQKKNYVPFSLQENTFYQNLFSVKRTHLGTFQTRE
jgi:hypothetical protein